METRKLRTFAPFLLIDGVLAFAIVMLLQLDWIINNTLYQYDLHFSLNWAMPYWMALRTSLTLLVLAITAVNVIGYYSYKNAGTEGEKAIFICESCGNAWTKLDKIVKTKDKLPKFKVLQTCPSCSEKLTKVEDKQVLQDYNIKIRVASPVPKTQKK